MDIKGKHMPTHRTELYGSVLRKCFTEIESISKGKIEQQIFCNAENATNRHTHTFLQQELN